MNTHLSRNNLNIVINVTKTIDFFRQR